jgi:hypothetical protein
MYEPQNGFAGRFLPGQKTQAFGSDLVTNPPSHTGSGFWPGNDPNWTEPPAKNRTAGGLPGPVTNTNQKSSVGQSIEPDLAEFLNCLFGGLSSKLAETSIFRSENWALPSRSSVHSCRQNQFKAGRNYHLAAGRANITWLGEISNFLVREYTILLGRNWSSSERFEFNQAEDWNFLFERVISNLIDTITFRL